MCEHEIVRQIDYLRKTYYPHLLGSDGKCCVSIKYKDCKTSSIEATVYQLKLRRG